MYFQIKVQHFLKKQDQILTCKTRLGKFLSDLNLFFFFDKFGLQEKTCVNLA